MNDYLDGVMRDGLTAAMAEKLYADFWDEKVYGDGTGNLQGLISATKITAYMEISDELIHPENYPRPEPVKVSRRLRFRWWRTRTRETVGYWIAGHDPEDDDW